MSQIKMVNVVPLKKGLFKDELTYFSTKDIPSGSIVSIKVRGKEILGLCLWSEEAKGIKSEIKNLAFELKKINSVKEKSFFKKEYLDTIIISSQYFASPKNMLAALLLPAIFRETYDKVSKIENKSRNLKNENKLKIKPEKLLFQNSFTDRISFYKIIIRESFAKKKSIFLILPTERDIEIFYQELSKGIENFIFPIHGNLSAQKQLLVFEKIISLEHPVCILGTVPYLSIPRHDIETIILEKENSNAYRTISRNTIDLRTFAEVFANKIGAKFIIGDTLLRFETLARKENDYLAEIRPLSYRINPENCIIEIFSKKREKVNGKKEKFQILSEKSLEEIKKRIERKEKIFIFSLRKGLATLTLCRDCGEIFLCDECSAPMVLYFSKDKKNKIFICNKCGNEKKSETFCKNCKSWNLIPLGIGTDTVYEELKNIFPKNEIFKIDKESTKTSKNIKRIISDFERSSGGILIATEIAFPYLSFKIPLSIVASFDSLWSIPNFKMSEKIISLLAQIISKTEKKLVLETKNEEDPAIKAVVNENLLPFVRSELEDRKKFGYPPYKRLIKITFLGDKEENEKVRKILAEIFQEYNPEIFSGFVAKLKNKYITNTLIKIAPEKWSLSENKANSEIDKILLSKLLSLPSSFSIKIDPEYLL